MAGSVGKSGAAVLASWAALRAGAGLVTAATPEPVLPTIAAHAPEIMTEPLVSTLAGTISARCFEANFFGKLVAGKSALGIGPGLTTQPETQEFVRGVMGMRLRVPIILDADGLNAFAGRAAELRDPKDTIAITPHPGEMARLARLHRRRCAIASRGTGDQVRGRLERVRDSEGASHRDRISRRIRVD